MSKNIKEIGKELMGKSLNSFHRKTGLPQLERNNEMQDGILDGILSQMDDAYIEKTEQSNVIHLEGSGDGVVVLDGIEGNTMVNCIKTLTGVNINSENISSTLNGRVLTYKAINGYEGNIHFSNIMRVYLHHSLKENTTYTLVVNVNDSCNVRFMSYDGTQTSTIISLVKGLNKKTFTANTLVNTDFNFRIESNPNNCREFIYSDFIILEGDCSNKEINYSEGLQSSFEEKVNDEGKYEIEILLNNKNLIDNSKSYQSSYASWIPNISSLNNVVKTDTYNATFSNRGVGFLVKDLKPNTQYTLSIPSLLTNNKLGYALYDNENSINNWNYHIQGQGNISTNKITFTTPNRKTVVVVGVYGSYDVLYNNGANDGTVVIGNYRKLQLEVGSKNTEFNLQKQNKIKLLLDEPLRSISTMKDKLCIKDGKLKVERNLGQVTFSGNEDWQDDWQYSNETDFLTRYYTLSYNEFGKYAKHPRRNVVTKCLSDSFSEVNCFSSVWGKQYNYIAIHEDSNPLYFQVSILKSMVGNDLTKQGFKNWIKNNGLSVVYPLAQPYYEEVLNEYGEPILLEGYENGTIYIDSTIVPTTTVRYTPKMESFKTLKEVNNDNTMLTNDVNDNIIPYMMDVDLMIMEKEMALMSHKNIRKMEVLDMTSMQKRTQEMLERLIKGKSLTEQECKTRITTYLNAGKITDEQAEELMLLIDEVYA